LLQNADYALCEAKGLGRNRFSSHKPVTDTAARQQAKMEYSLRKAIEREELVVQYQPLIDVRTGEIQCAEALVRWKHPSMGVIPPRQFIPLAEETGVIHNLGRFVRETACRQCVDWLNKGLPPVAASVNVSPVEFQRDGFPQDVVRTIKDAGMDARWFVVELTEAALLGDHDRIMDTLGELKTSGISISVDDFGAGYSSLSLLKDYPIDTIKIDRAFIREIVSNGRNETIARAMVDMAHALDIAVVAEGVETVEQALLLRAMNCDMAQGYLFSRPISPDGIASLLASGPVNVPGLESPEEALDYQIRESSG
jgi:EAL domain-containing protein (putative c-di-GMP-specific phosphodiesterase class I)